MPFLHEVLAYVLAAVAGGGLWKLWDFFLRSRKQSHEFDLADSEVARQLRDEMRSDLDALRSRVGHLETQLGEERELRLKAELQNQLLQMKIDLLISMVNDLRENQGLDPIDGDSLVPVL